MPRKQPSIESIRKNPALTQAGKTSLRLHPHRTFARPLLVLAFPTVGGVGAIAARFLVEHVKLPLLGSISARTLPSTVLIHRGHVEPGVAVYGKDCVCGPKGICQALFVVTSTVPIEGQAVWDVAEALHELIGSNHVVLTIALEGQAVEEIQDPANVFGFAQGSVARRSLRELGVGRVVEGALGGVAGALLARDEGRRPDVLVLAAEAHQEHLDPRGGAALMKILSEHFVHIDLDLAPMLEEAQRLEAKIRLETAASNRAARQAGESLSTMYG